MLFMLLWKSFFRSSFRRMIREHLPATLTGQYVNPLEHHISDPERALNVGAIHPHQRLHNLRSENPSTIFEKGQLRLMVGSKGQLTVERNLKIEKRMTIMDDITNTRMRRMR